MVSWDISGIEIPCSTLSSLFQAPCALFDLFFFEFSVLLCVVGGLTAQTPEFILVVSHLVMTIQSMLLFDWFPFHVPDLLSSNMQAIIITPGWKNCAIM
jgi:uncharacterized membrane protein YpjA